MPRRRSYRQYGLSNANQILLAMIVCTLLFFALLRQDWLNLDLDGTAGLWNLRLLDANGNKTTVGWRTFCSADGFKFVQPVEKVGAPAVTEKDYRRLCALHSPGGVYLPEIIRALICTSIGFSIVTLLCALYLQLGNPTRGQVFWLGAIPGLALFICAVLCTAVLILWQSSFGSFDNGDCFSVTVAGTVIAYAVAISMVIRWRWPGVCAVPNEQQAFDSRLYTYGRRGQSAPTRMRTAPPPPPSQLDTNTNGPHSTGSTFHQLRG